MYKTFEVLSLLQQQYGNVNVTMASSGPMHKICVQVRAYERQHDISLEEDDFDLTASQIFLRIRDQIESENGFKEKTHFSDRPLGHFYDSETGWLSPEFQFSWPVILVQLSFYTLIVVAVLTSKWCL